MSEQQPDYDTDDTQPTPGPAWAEGTYVIASPNDGRPNGEVILGPRSYGNDISADEQRANAKLCGAAFTAASELPEEYDPVAAMRQLPKMLELLELAMNGPQHFRGLCPEGQSAKDHEVIGRIKNVLDTAHKDTQTDE